MQTLWDLEKAAIEELQGQIAYFDQSKQNYEIEDLVSEVADRLIPIYTWDLLEVALSNYWLAIEIPEGCWSGQLSALQLISFNIYEYLSTKLSDWYYENKKE